MATRPRMTGRAPLSPLRTRVHQILAYSPKVSAMTSGAAVDAVCSATSSAASGGGWTSALTGAPWWLLGWRPGWRPGRGGGEAPGGARGHQVDDRLGVVLGQRPDRDHLAQAQHGHPVGDGLDVVQVVRDDEDRDALVPEPADEVEHDPGLRDAQDGRWRVQECGL